MTNEITSASSLSTCCWNLVFIYILVHDTVGYLKPSNFQRNPRLINPLSRDILLNYTLRKEHDKY